jgi:hypothetical protein
VLAAGTAAGLAAAIPLAATAPARAAAGLAAAGAPPVSVVINAMRPGFAQPGGTVTISGSVTNASAAPISALSIQLASSGQAFGSRDALQGYAGGSDLAVAAVPRAAFSVRHVLAPKATAHWSIRLPVSRLRITSFGVYPLAAQATSSIGAVLDTSRTFLPYWPAKSALKPARQQIAWIWPLVDQPRQSPCGSLTSNGLADSMAAGGRLAGLVAVGAAYTSRAQLTWAVDPALLADAQTMASPYQISSSAQCGGATLPASQPARSWFGEVRAATAGQPVFVTPYADVDAVALVHRGLNADLTRAFTEGRSAAGRLLGRDFSPAERPGTGSSAVLNGLAWPPAGIADYPTLQSLAGGDGISSVVLDSSTMPPLTSSPPTPSARTTTPDGEGPDLRVLVSDNAITRILGSVNAGARAAGNEFAAQQYFLAQTAMIAAEAPGLARSVVVAPPSRWNPPPKLAGDLLADTVSAPWLRPARLARLMTAKSAPSHRKLTVPRRVARAGLGRPLLRQVRGLDQRVQLLQGIQARPDQALNYAITATESSAWGGRGPAAGLGRRLLRQVAGYVTSQEGKLMLVGAARVTLGGLKGIVPVSVANHLSYPVRVRLQVSVPGGGSIRVRSQPGVLRVPAGAVLTVKLNVSTAAVGSTTLRLSLLTPGGAPLPSPPVLMTIQATHYGTLALIIIAAALGVFMLTSATKAVRRGRGGQQPAGGGADQPGPGPGQSAGEPPDSAESPHPVAEQPQWADGPPRLPGGPASADNVGSGPAGLRESGPAGVRATPGPDDLEDADEYARTPGRADHD